MSNRIFKTVVNRKIENFVSTFVLDSTSIFFDDQNKLFHPGEYGKYRESALKELVKHFTRHKVSDGFIITPDDRVSTQLDIVVYKNDESPILEKNHINFFSIESVIAIGEVKSTLSKAELKAALVKLATNKKLRESSIGKCCKKEYNSVEHDEIISFLVCKTTSFDLTTLNFDEVYDGIENKYRHNFILDLEKGLIGYEFRYNDLGQSDIELFVNNGGSLEATVYYEYPVYTFIDNVYNFLPVIHNAINTQKYYHIKLFLTQLAQAIEYKNLYNTEFVHYLDLPIAPIFKNTP